jgi:hypothetical protein
MTRVVEAGRPDREAEVLRHVDLEPLVRDCIVAVKPNETWLSGKDETRVTQSALCECGAKSHKTVLLRVGWW